MLNTAIIAEKIYTMNNNYLIVIVGPTAIGKTSLSIELATHFGCEIVSADSRQFYKEMRIGTAVPSSEELSRVKHHFIQHKSIKNTYSAGNFEKDALEKLAQLFQQHRYAILVGGSGLYVDAVTKGLDNFPDVDASVRNTLLKNYEERGIEYLQQQLKLLDPEHYEKVDLQNMHRVMRALEVCLGTGQPYSSFLSASQKKRNFHTIKIGITAPREIIYHRINERVDVMIQQGLIDEAKALYPYKSLNALNTVGYKELFTYLDDQWELDIAISEIKKNTRRFAKRQGTWFRKDADIKWFDHQYDLLSVIGHIKKSSL